MTKKITVITVLILSIIFISTLVVTSTYAVIVNVTESDNVETTNDIIIRDLLTNDNDEFNSIYYIVKSTLNLTKEEMDTVMESLPLNIVLERVINNVTSNKLHGTVKYTNNELYDMLVTALNEDNNINEHIRMKIIDKSRGYIQEISDYLYNIFIFNNLI